MLDYSFTYNEFEIFLLVLMRVATFLFVAPFFTMTNTPRHVRVLIAFFVTVLLFGVVPHDSLQYTSLLSYLILVLKEVLTGLLVGLSANLCTMIVNFAGHVADMEMGLSMVTLMDPTTRDNVTITGVYYNYMITLMLIISGMHRYIIEALAETYILIPINGQIFHTNLIMSSMLGFITRYILIGFRICLPIFATMIVLNAVLGVLAKVSPQLNMFAVGMQLKVFTGLSILFISSMMLPTAAEMIFDEMKRAMVSMVQAIR